MKRVDEEQSALLALLKCDLSKVKEVTTLVLAVANCTRREMQTAVEDLRRTAKEQQGELSAQLQRVGMENAQLITTVADLRWEVQQNIPIGATKLEELENRLVEQSALLSKVDATVRSRPWEGQQAIPIGAMKLEELENRLVEQSALLSKVDTTVRSRPWEDQQASLDAGLQQLRNWTEHHVRQERIRKYAVKSAKQEIHEAFNAVAQHLVEPQVGNKRNADGFVPYSPTVHGRLNC